MEAEAKVAEVEVAEVEVAEVEVAPAEAEGVEGASFLVPTRRPLISSCSFGL